jgi:hypothetical protein
MPPSSTMWDDKFKSGVSDSKYSSNYEERMSPAEFLSWVNATYGAPQFQEEMDNRT